MKLLLKQDIRNLGMTGDVVEVKEGYARNYLLPQDLAMAPTEANMKAIAEARARAAELRRLRAEEMKAAAERMTDLEIEIRAACNEDGGLYGSVGPREVASAIRELGHTVEPDQVLLSSPIRHTGPYEVPIRFGDELEVQVKVWVHSETAGKEDEAGDDAESDTEDTDVDHRDHAGFDD